VFNKADRAPEEAKRLVAAHPGSVAISAATGEGIEELLQVLADRMRAISKVIELLVPYDRGDVLASIHREGEVVSTADGDDGVRVRARLSESSAGRLAAFVVGAGAPADRA
jgi:GTP-binding protein HflX